MGTGALKVTIDVAEERDPLNGSVAADHGDPRQFTGWLELMSALQDILEERDSETTQSQGAQDCRN